MSFFADEGPARITAPITVNTAQAHARRIMQVPLRHSPAPSLPCPKLSRPGDSVSTWAEFRWRASPGPAYDLDRPKEDKA